MDLFNKKTKTKELVLYNIRERKFDELRPLISNLKKENEYVLSGFDEAVNELLKDQENNRLLSDFFLFLMNSNSPTFFKLYYDSLLFNPTLYALLIQEQGYETEGHFDHYLLFKADDFEEKEAKTYALSVLSMLKDSFFVKDEIEKKFK